MPIVQVALPVPKRQLFDYLSNQEGIQPGVRVTVPFAGRTLLGIVVRCCETSQFERSKIKAVIKILDKDPVIDVFLLKISNWLSQYYQYSLGEVLQTVMPVALRKGESPEPKPIEYLELTEAGQKIDLAEFAKAKKQKMLLTQLCVKGLPLAQVRQQFSPTIIKALREKLLIQTVQKQTPITSDWQSQLSIAEKPRANVQQALAITGIEQQSTSYNTFLLEGVTGSGKTEVYLQAIESVLARGQQVLILVPEIGLTPQTVFRFKQRFSIEVGVLHSNLTDNERLLVWQQARAGQLGLVIGTRSAIFTPLKKPGMLIVDEEHDSSYKQQDGLRYNARDLAVIRAKQDDIPLVLGTATPSLESLNNALTGRYLHYILDQRAGNAVHAKQNVLDIKGQPLEYGLAKGMLERIRQHLEKGSQVMLFINRRGFAPALLCHQCAHSEDCQRCNKPFTLHKQLNRLQCHHCGSARAIPRVCNQCGSADILPHGIGTEQLEQGLQKLFPEYASVRIDSDSARGKTKLQSLLDKVNSNQFQLLIGTQILSKGHHFPNVTLVVILDADGALFSADFRAAEHLAQLITQLSGRAGRADKPGEMWLQTHNPGHPLLQDLIHNGYGHFARFALLERQQANLPPHAYMALIRAEATDPRLPHDFLSRVVTLFSGRSGLAVIGPLPALMEKRQGRYRMQLLLQSNHRTLLQKELSQQITTIENDPLARKVRWSIDVDPQDFL